MTAMEKALSATSKAGTVRMWRERQRRRRQGRERGRPIALQMVRMGNLLLNIIVVLIDLRICQSITSHDVRGMRMSGPALVSRT